MTDAEFMVDGEDALICCVSSHHWRPRIADPEIPHLDLDLTSPACRSQHPSIAERTKTPPIRTYNSC